MLALAVEDEAMAEAYCHAKRRGEPPRLDNDDFNRSAATFTTYGVKR